MRDGTHCDGMRPKVPSCNSHEASLAVIGLIAGWGAWRSGRGVWWLIGGVILGAVIPLTFLVIFPTIWPDLHPFFLSVDSV